MRYAISVSAGPTGSARLLAIAHPLLNGALPFKRATRVTYIYTKRGKSGTFELTHTVLGRGRALVLIISVGRRGTGRDALAQATRVVESSLRCEHL